MLIIGHENNYEGRRIVNMKMVGGGKTVEGPKVREAEGMWRRSFIIKGGIPERKVTELPLSTGHKQLFKRLAVGSHHIALVRNSGEGVCWITSHKTVPDFGIVVCVVFKDDDEYVYYRDFLTNIMAATGVVGVPSARWHLVKLANIRSYDINVYKDLEEVLKVIQWYPPKTYIT